MYTPYKFCSTFADIFSLLQKYFRAANKIRKKALPMEQRTLKIVNNCLNTNIYSYLETSGGQSFNLYLNVVHFFNTSVN
jgi:hypothetical protein